ncbi:lipid A-modifier LpxR family protein [uncultured Lacinutrix sp.]|uniref:lipid A-modifier LpxR family protein n=1 Tax=uncultured Lacinutrix sp. TaxID=574032 RepID=UPI0026089464|nr:lipid A-modifier LpxR family protein [uncultured Lacinutrix sp.]
MKKLFYLIYLLTACSLIAQNNNEQIELRIENDKLVLVDKYYTSGLFLSYKKSLDNNFVFKKNNKNALQLNIVLGNETYTPSNLMSSNSKDFDRPYAGWFFLKTELGSVKNNTALFVAVETGITGKEALSGKLQTWVHDFLNINDNPTWFQEIEFKFLVNLKAKYILNKTIGKYQAFQYNIESSIGTKDIFLENGISYVFGKFNNLKYSSRIGVIDRNTVNELFGFINFGYRYVVHNTLIQGSLDYKDTFFTINRAPHIIKFKAGIVFKTARNTFRFIYNFNTKETPIANSHAYGTLSYSRDF